eukprot:18086-Heterococcus_DN1.PRE.5
MRAAFAATCSRHQLRRLAPASGATKQQLVLSCALAGTAVAAAPFAAWCEGGTTAITEKVEEAPGLMLARAQAGMRVSRLVLTVCRIIADYEGFELKQKLGLTTQTPEQKHLSQCVADLKAAQEYQAAVGLDELAAATPQQAAAARAVSLQARDRV